MQGETTPHSPSGEDPLAAGGWTSCLHVPFVSSQSFLLHGNRFLLALGGGRAAVRSRWAPSQPGGDGCPLARFQEFAGGSAPGGGGAGFGGSSGTLGGGGESVVEDGLVPAAAVSVSPARSGEQPAEPSTHPAHAAQGGNLSGSFASGPDQEGLRFPGGGWEEGQVQGRCPGRSPSQQQAECPRAARGRGASLPGHL